MDLAGRRYDRVTDDQREAAIAVHRRGNRFKQEIIELSIRG
jgi:hypothetical protein